MNPFFCFSCTRGFCFSYSTVFISTHEFSHSSDSLPQGPGGSEQVALHGKTPAVETVHWVSVSHDMNYSD